MSKRIDEISDIRLNEETKEVVYHHTVVDVADDGSKLGIAGGDETVYDTDGKTPKKYETIPSPEELVEYQKGRVDPGIEVEFAETATPLKD